MPAATDSSAHHSARPSACATSVSARHLRVWPQRGTSCVAGIVGCVFRSPLQKRIGTGTGIRPHLFLTRVLWRAKNGSAKGVSGTTKPRETEAGTAGMQPSPRDNLVGAHASRCGQRGRSNSNLALPPPSHFSPHRTNRPPHALKILFRFSRALKHPLVGAAPPCALAGFAGRGSRRIAPSDQDIKLGRFSLQSAGRYTPTRSTFVASGCSGTTARIAL